MNTRIWSWESETQKRDFITACAEKLKALESMHPRNGIYEVILDINLGNEKTEKRNEQS